MNRHIPNVGELVVVFVALMILLLATVIGAYMPLGRLHFAVAMLIATAKGLLVLLYFMHVRYSSRATWVFSGAAFLWLAIMIVLSLSDYTTRNWLVMPGHY